MLCDKKGHDLKPHLKVCFHPDCIQAFCCELCISQQHLNHDFFLIPIKVIQKRSRDQGEIFYGSPIVKELEQIKNKLYRFISSIEHQIRKFQQIEFQELALARYVVNRHNYIDEYFEDICEILELQNNKVSLKQFDKRLHDSTLQGFPAINNAIDSQLIKIQSQSYIQKQNYKFSQRMKHPDIKILNDDMALKNGWVSFSIVFGQDSFQPQLNSFRFAFKILKRDNNVLVGIGGDTHADYIFQDYNTLGHHKYMIGYHKYSYHHSDKRVNNIMSSFAFDTGDMINISYNCLNGTLMFQKLNTNEYFKMTLSEADLSKPLYPVAWLLGKGDQVQLMNYQE